MMPTQRYLIEKKRFFKGNSQFDRCQRDAAFAVLVLGVVCRYLVDTRCILRQLLRLSP